ncbi:MAG: carbon-nitrogen hydrolase family protein [Alphaproteobacteria bacterium]|nr:carbon-nitrogen hydrolase family protein [Alphaproteobacteria bacterium]
MCSGVDVADNIRAASALIREAASGGARLVATPEMTSLMDHAPGAIYAKSRPEADDPALAAFRALAAELGVWLLIGSLPIRADGGLCANRSYLIGPDGAIAARYDKIHRFDVQLSADNVHRESRDFTAGEEAVVAALPGARLGMTVCYDVRFPHLHRDLARAGADILAVPAAFNSVSGAAHWHVLLRARAIETGCFVIAPAQCGTHEDGRKTFGHSLIISPWGEILSEAGDAPGVIHARLDLDDVASARARIPALQHDRAYQPA